MNLPPVSAALLRFAAILIAMGLAGLIYTLVPDPTVRTGVIGLEIAAIGAAEEYLKHSQSSQSVGSGPPLQRVAPPQPANAAPLPLAPTSANETPPLLPNLPPTGANVPPAPEVLPPPTGTNTA